MDSRLFLALFLCFFCFFPFLSHSANRLPVLLRNNNMGESVAMMKTSPPSVTIDPTRVTQISWRPRAFIYEGFLSAEECDHLINLARDKLAVSMVADDKTGVSIRSQERTSTGMFLLNAQDQIVAAIESRIAAWTFLPSENGEAIQILRYENGQKYEPHFDYFSDQVNIQRGGHRVATVLMYLSNVKKGGETVFPLSEVKLSEEERSDLSDCVKHGYAVKPRKGDAILFFGLHPNATTDPRSLHGSCPVIEGEKWSATKWIHVKSLDMRLRKGGCVDDHKECPMWAKAGECERNPNYMVGFGDGSGYCLKSCNAC